MEVLLKRRNELLEFTLIFNTGPHVCYVSTAFFTFKVAPFFHGSYYALVTKVATRQLDINIVNFSNDD